jgi:adenine deaminase
MKANRQLSGQLIDLHQRRIYPAEIQINEGKISSITELETAPDQFILPGFIDAHVHIESSMLPPSAFAALALPHGTVATVSDPHEIANVCGMEGVRWMISEAENIPFKCFFGAPSCVPATNFETAGAEISAREVAELLGSKDIWYLSEMMNYPGVLNHEPEVWAKLKAAQAAGKPIDGHAPGLMGEAALQYAAAGISTDHECISLDEALNKISGDMHILIREGSAAKNFGALHPLLGSHPERVMFCSDDKHPDELLTGHINELVRRSLELGYDLFDVLRAACVNPVLHYRLPVGLLRVGDPADCIIIPDLKSWKPLQTYIDGELAATGGRALFQRVKPSPINNFRAHSMRDGDLDVQAPGDSAEVNVRTIIAHDGQLVTSSEIVRLPVQEGKIQGDPDNDVLKLAVVNRYHPEARPALAFIKGFGFREGAIASTVAHDCHNIIAVGANDASICAAINAVIDAQGGIAVAHHPERVGVLPLPIAGLMSDRDGAEVAATYNAFSQAAKELGSPLAAPFMTLSFMALLVIPSLKLSDKGLFDGKEFRFAELVVES